MKKNLFTLVLIFAAALFAACEPGGVFPGDDMGGDGPELPIPTPTPDPTPTPTPETVTATLTYSECKSILVKSYGNPKSYTNAFGTWVICVYDNSNGMQINKGKVAKLSNTSSSILDLPEIARVNLANTPSFVRSNPLSNVSFFSLEKSFLKKPISFDI